MIDSGQKKVPAELDGQRLDAAVRKLFEFTWNKARKVVEGGKISVEGEVVADGATPVKEGETILFLPDAPRPKGEHSFDPRCVVFKDRHVLVANKPAGILTVPWERGDKGSFDQQVRGYLAKDAGGSSSRRGALPALMVVHRLDRGTSGLLVFARTWLAKEGLAQQLRDHSMERVYLALVHGAAQSKRIVSHILENRGDGIRGSSETSPHPKVRKSQKGKRAVTNVELVRDLNGASLVSCRLETGRTNQIRIHMSEDGHPLIGERVYMRNYTGEKIPAERLMLHAARLSFVHPATSEKVSFEAQLPEPFERIIQERSRGGA